MRAVVLRGAGCVEVTDDWPEPAAPGPDEVLITMRSVGLCGSDLSVVDGKIRTPHYPWVLGHEGGGVVEELGRDVRHLRVGQPVVVEPNYPCAACHVCLSGRTSACPSRRAVGINVQGLLAERFVAPARHVWPVPDGSDDALLACIEPLAVARAAVQRSGIRRGDRALVLGAGSQGLLLCQALLAAGVMPSVVEPHAGRRDRALELGARAHDAEDEPAPFVFNTADASAAWETAIASTASGGTLVMIGMSDEPVPLSTRHLVRRQLTIRGTLIYDHPDGFASTIDAIVSEQLAPTEVLQEGLHPDEAVEAFTQARNVAGKSWIAVGAWQDAAHGIGARPHP